MLFEVIYECTNTVDWPQIIYLLFFFFFCTCIKWFNFVMFLATWRMNMKNNIPSFGFVLGLPYRMIQFMLFSCWILHIVYNHTFCHFVLFADEQVVFSIWFDFFSHAVRNVAVSFLTVATKTKLSIGHNHFNVSFRMNEKTTARIIKLTPDNLHISIYIKCAFLTSGCGSYT